jgi:hypothetical protein
MSLLGRLRTWRSARHRRHEEQEEEELEATARGDTYTLGEHRDEVRSDYDKTTRGEGQVGR